MLRTVQQELRSAYGPYLKVDLASHMISRDTCDVGQIYHELLIEQEELFPRKKLVRATLFGSTAIDKLPNIVIVKGETGSGKTVLFKKLVHDWTAGGTHEGVMKGFDLVLKMDCQERNSSIRDLLGQLLPNIEGEALHDLMLNHELKILFLVDNLEDLNENSEVLLDEILSLASSGVHILCATRPLHAEALKSKLSHSSISYMVVRMAGVPSYSRIPFITRILNSLVPGDVSKETKERLYIRFKNAGTWCQKHFTSPFNLTTVALLYMHNEDIISCLETGTSFFSHVEKFRVQKLVDHLIPKLSSSCVDRLEFNCRKIAKILSQLAFECIKVGKSSLSTTEMSELRDRCSELELPVGDVLSAFLKREGDSYSFESNSSQNFMAAKHIMYSVKDQPMQPLDFTQTCHGVNPDVVFFVIGLLADMFPPVLARNADVLIQQAANVGMTEVNYWLDLLHEGKCDEALAEAVSHEMKGKNRWNITENHLPALKTLLRVTWPEYLLIRMDDLEKDPECVSELSEALEIVATKPILLSLEFNYYFVMMNFRDSILRRLIEHPNRRVLINGYQGYISSSLMQNLPASLRYLHLQVYLEELKSLAAVLPTLKDLLLLEIFLRGSRYKETLPLLSFSESAKLSICISGVHNGSNNWVKTVLTTLSRRPYYKVKFLNSSVTPEGAVEMMKDLNRSKVSFLRDGSLEIRTSAYGSLTAKDKQILETESRHFNIPLFVRDM